MGPAHEFSRPGVPCDRGRQQRGPAGCRHGASMGDRSGTPAREAAAAAALRALFPAGRVRRASQIHIAQRALRPAVGDRISGTAPVSPMIVRSMRLAVLSLLLQGCVAAAAAADQSSGAPLPARITLEDSVDAPSAAPEMTRHGDPATFPIGVRLEAALSKE